MYVILWGAILILVLVFTIPFASGGVIMSLALIMAIIALIVVAKRNLDIKKHNLNKYDENELIIQNVQKGGVIRLAHLDGQTGNLDLKVVSRNLYMEGDYSWYELECINADGEKFWIDVDDDDELTVSVVIDKPKASDLKFSSSLDNIDENESGNVEYKGKQYYYADSGDAIFYKYCDDKRKERLYYYDFKCGNSYILSAEKWKNSDGTSSMEYFVSQIIKPSTITVYSTKGENNTNE